MRVNTTEMLFIINLITQQLKFVVIIDLITIIVGI